MKKIINGLFLFLKGFIMGVGNVIPGVSGGTLAVILGIYDKFISSISHIFSKLKESILFLLPIILGMGIAIIVSSKVIDWAFTSYPFATALLFEGMIIGGVPLLYKKIKGNVKKVSNITIFLIIFTLLLVYALVFGGVNNNVVMTDITIMDYIVLFLIGIIGAATMIIPGLSGSMTLKVLGYYELIVQDTLSSITDFSLFGRNMQILIPFGIGCVVGMLLIAKLIEFLLKKYEVKSYFGIFGFIFASIIIIFVQIFSQNPNHVFGFGEIICGIIIFFIGLFGSYFLSIGKIKIGSFEPFKNKKENK